MFVPAMMLALAAADPTTSDARLLTGIAAQGAASDARADVLTSTDLRTAVDLEAQKQLASCDANASCMAEIASALDAQIVVSGSLARAGSTLVLQLSVYDVRKASSAGRRTLTGADTGVLIAPTEAAARELLAPLVVGVDRGRVRVLVLDFELLAEATSATAASPATPLSTPPATPLPFGALSLVGGGVGILGVAGLGAGVYFDGRAADAQRLVANPREVDTVDAFDEARSRRDNSIVLGWVGFIGGAVLVAAGVGVVIFDGVNP
jgi:hypothetical protein